MGLIKDEFDKEIKKEIIPIEFELGEREEIKIPPKEESIKPSIPVINNNGRDIININTKFIPTNYRKHVEYIFDFNATPELKDMKLDDLIDSKVVNNAVVKIDVRGSESDKHLFNEEIIKQKLGNCFQLKPIIKSFVQERIVRNKEIKVSVNAKENMKNYVEDKKFLPDEDKKNILKISYELME